MALFEGTKRQEGTRSNTHLIKSGHMSPAEKWLLDPNFKKPELSGIYRDGVLFDYEYGGPGQTEVTIAKGRAVGVAAPVKDFVTKQYVSTITLPGLAPGNNCVGLVPYNITKDWFQQDRFGGNQPSIITLDYVQLPYIPGVEASTHRDINGIVEEEQALSLDLKNPWGAVIGKDLKEGDYLMATASGRLAKWDGVSAMDVVGQILARDFNSEPMGWFKWMMWDESTKREDDMYINKSGASNLPSDSGYPFDPQYADGTLEMDGYQSRFTTNPTGVPGLHDGSGNYAGFGKNDTPFENMVLGLAPEVIDGTLMAFQAVDYAGAKRGQLKQGVQVFIDGVAVENNRLHVDYTRGVITIALMNIDKGKVITATYKANQYGTPSSWDFKGVIGAFNILLKR